MKISNEEIRNRANINTISEQIFRRRWKFIGHILRMDPSKHPKTALTWAPEGRRSRGRPRETWRRTAERERAALGFGSWNEAAEEQRKQQRKIARKEKKQKPVVDDGDIDPDLAATMGFAGFGTSKK
ncbi:hypothetical protein ACROYT_G002653 [Oculina patagonica]